MTIINFKFLNFFIFTYFLSFLLIIKLKITITVIKFYKLLKNFSIILIMN